MWNKSINIMYINDENLFMVPNHKKNKDYYANPFLSYLMDKLWFSGKMAEEMLLVWNQSIDIMYPNDENMFMVLNHKRSCDY